MEITIKIQIDTDSNGNIIIGDVTQTVDVATIVEGDFFLTQSQKKYNYVTIGKTSPIQLPRKENIKAIFNDVVVLTHTHSSQLNRIDGLKKILDNFNITEHVFVFWDASKKTLTFKKSES